MACSSDENGDGKINPASVSSNENGDGKISPTSVSSNENGDGKISSASVSSNENGDEINPASVSSNENCDGKINPASVPSNVKATFNSELIEALLNESLQDDEMELGNDTLPLVVELAKCLVTETCLRASNQALTEGSDKVDIEHVEKCLPQLMLDFPLN